MFKISVPITKTVKKGTKLIVEGYASDTTIDRDEERFSAEAIKTMKDSIHDGGVQIRLEHENKFYTNIGNWIDADVTKDNRLYVKGEIDTELSLGKDVEVLLNRGQKLELSVGGRVIDATTEYIAKLRRTIKVYTNVVLEEISILLTPSNYNTSLGIAKSVDWEKIKTGHVVKAEGTDHVPYTTEAQKAYDMYRKMEKLKPDVFEIGWRDKNMNEQNNPITMKDWLNAVGPQVESVMKDDCCEDGYSPEMPLNTIDLQLIAKLMQVMNQVKLPTDAQVEEVYTEEYWAKISDMGEDGYIILSDGTLTLPHHNPDYTVNKDWVLIRLKQLIDGQGYWKAEDFTIAMNHLYKHLKELNLIKSTNKSVIMENDQLSAEELDVLQKAYEFAKGKVSEPPKLSNGQQMTKEQLEKCALAYEKISKSPNFNSLINHSTMNKTTSDPVDPVNPNSVTADNGRDTEVKDLGAETKLHTEGVGSSPAKVEGENHGGTMTPEQQRDWNEANRAAEEKEFHDKPKATVEVDAQGNPIAPTGKPAAGQLLDEDHISPAKPEDIEQPKKSQKSVKKGDRDHDNTEDDGEKTGEEQEEEFEEEEGTKKKSVRSSHSDSAFNKAKMAGFEKAVLTLNKQVNVLTKAVQDMDELKQNITKMSTIVEKLANIPLRKGINSHVAMEKAMQGQGEGGLNFEEALDAQLKKGLPFPLAYQQAKEITAAAA